MTLWVKRERQVCMKDVSQSPMTSASTALSTNPRYVEICAVRALFFPLFHAIYIWWHALDGA